MAQSEAAFHRSVAEYLDRALRLPVIWTTIPVGGGGRVRGALLKAMGLKRGWPDIIVLAPGPKVIGIELKTEKGKLSGWQQGLRDCFNTCQASYAVARTLEHVEVILKQNDIPLHARLT